MGGLLGVSGLRGMLPMLWSWSPSTSTVSSSYSVSSMSSCMENAASDFLGNGADRPHRDRPGEEFGKACPRGAPVLTVEALLKDTDAGRVARGNSDS